MRVRLGLALVSLLAIVACGSDDEPVPTTDGITTTTAASAPLTAVHVEDDGIVVDGKPVRFGATRDDVTFALGPPTDEGEQPECSAGPSSFLRYDEHGLLLVVQDGELVGWSLDPESTLTTSAGIGIGSTKSELEAAHGPAEMIPDSTLGVEFFYEGGMTGLLKVESPDGAITAIWSGVVCVFR